jgi:hypothetical protein
MVGFLAAAAAALLVVSGAAKVRAPQFGIAAVRALVPCRSTTAYRLVRLTGAGESAVGIAFLARGGLAAAAALAASYALLTVVAGVLFVRGDVSCGCFGRPESRIGGGHLLLDAVALLAALGSAAAPVGPIGGALRGGAVVAAAGLLQIAVLAALGYLAVTSLPALLAARRTGALR